MVIKNFSSKPRAAFFDFACCEGCQLTVLQLDDRLLELMAHVEIIEWRQVMSGRGDKYDIAFCEGGVVRNEDVDRIRSIRDRTDILAALGSCASIACHNSLRNEWNVEYAIKHVYGENAGDFDLIPVRPISEVVEVDYQATGCPVSLKEFVTVFEHILTGKIYRPPNDPVCRECKQNDYVCVYEKGRICLGPVTRCGCGAACVAHGDACHGCRGLVDDANTDAVFKALEPKSRHTIMEQMVRKNRLTETDLMKKLSIYDPPKKPENGKE